jgi:MFS family permease
LILAPKGVAWPLLLAWCMRGVEMGHMCMTTMSMEIVPTEYRGRWIGILGFLQNLVRIVAMFFGGYLYETINPNLVFIIPVVIDAFILIPILFTIPDTLKKENGVNNLNFI